MIHIAPGHEKSISLEILFKALRLLPRKAKAEVTLHLRERELSRFLKDSKAFSLSELGPPLSLCYFEGPPEKSFSLVGLESALSHLIPSQDILITLPTTKDSLQFKGSTTLGYTEYFRQRYKENALTMGFKYKKKIFLLLTDHISLREVPKALTKKLVQKKISSALNQIKYLFGRPKEIYLSGINPHAGEQGLLGHEEKVFSALPAEIKGPLPGDSLSFYLRHPNDEWQIFIYAFHDQGLGFFKGQYAMMGCQITFGLDFVRFSVDHGTAFNLYGENTANPMGLYTTFLEALHIQNHIKSTPKT